MTNHRVNSIQWDVNFVNCVGEELVPISVGLYGSTLVIGVSLELMWMGMLW